MISRAACVPRICLTCRLGLTSSRAALCARASPGQERWIRRRYYASDSVIQSKKKIEALIRGTMSNKTSHETADKHVQRGPTPQDETESDPKRKQDVRNLETTEQQPLEGEPFKKAPNPNESPTNNNNNNNNNNNSDRWPKQKSLIHHKQLGVEALGKPVEALVIKNPNRMKRPNRPVRMLEEEITGPHIDLQWESLVPNEEQDADEVLAQALRNIDELRPVDTTVLRIKEFDALVKSLVDGFMLVHLDAYLEERKPSGTKPKAAEPPKYSWILEQAPRSPPNKPDHLGHLTPKQTRAIAIMRTIWNLGVQEQHVEGFSKSQFWLRPEVFQLITRPSSSILESLRANFLLQSNKERIVPNFDEARINIYARKSTVPVILARLDEIVRSTTTEKISVRHVKDEDLLPDVLQELGRITKTGIQYDKKKAELEISWLADDGRTHPAATEQDGVSGQTEGPADVVLRLLTGREMRELQSTVQVIAPDPKVKMGGFVSHQRERRSMSWKDKLHQWSRYVTPVGKQSPANVNSALFSGRVSLPAPTFEATQSETRNRIIATFGHVLHSKSELMEAKLARNRRILSPVIPHPAAFKSITVQDKPVAQHTAILLNFAPNPTQTTWFDGIVPEVCLRLPVDPNTDLSNFSFPPDSTLHGIVPWQVSDILLPSESVDVRLAQHRLLPLDVNQQSLKDFLAACEFNLLQGRLRTPSKTTFSIPARWLSAAASKGDAATLDIPYLFMGLEIHQAVEMEWQGYTLRYNSIEAGQHGGQRQELLLRAGSPLQGDDGDHPLDEAEKTRFLQLAEEIATGKHFSWHGGYQLMQERSDEKFSLNMMEEESDGEEAQEADGSGTLSSSIKGQEPAKEDQDSANSGGNQETPTTSDDTSPASNSTMPNETSPPQEATPLGADATSPRTTS